MKTLRINPSSSITDIAEDAASILRDGGLVCLPCAGRYRIVADLLNPDAVMRLMQAKSRVKTAPALVFISGEGQIERVAGEVPALARKIAKELWPKPVTIRIAPNPDLPAKVLKHLGGKKLRLGVRVPAGTLMRAVLEAVDSPLLVSSANRQKKAGESSPAQIARTFAPHVDLFLNEGDLAPDPASTIVSIVDDAVVIERQGAVDAASIAGCAPS